QPGGNTWTVPAGVTSVTFDVFGASGGNAVTDNNVLLALGGGGGEARGTFSVTPGEQFEVVVGGAGADSNQDQDQSLSDVGFKGGGPGALPHAAFGTVRGGEGGGASDVRLCPASLEADCEVFHRIVVGGGGGGAGGAAGFTGGAGGGVNGQVGVGGAP